MKTGNYLSEIAKKIQPYTWEFGRGKEMRFNSNTLPFPPKSLKKFFQEIKKECPINEYADPTYANLKKLLSEYENVQTDQVTITNSGDEAIDILAKTFLNPEDYFIVTPPTYEMFSIQCEINRGVRVEIPLENQTWNINADKIIQASKNPKTKLIFLCNPNNPTASITPQKIIEQIVKESDAIVVIDETYREFYGKTSVPLIKKYNNVVVLRSFSKFAGIAGARIGYLLAKKQLSQKFDAIRFPMGVSYFSYKLAETVLRNDKLWMQEQVKIIKKERTRLTKEFSKLGFTVYPSETNFLLVNIGKNAKEIYKALKEKNIYIRDRSNKKNLEGCVRITVRFPKENNVLLTELKKIIKKMQNKYAFIDRDGTIIFEPQDTFQVDSLNTLKILDGVVKGLQELIKNGFQLIMVSNQDGLGTKQYPKKKFDVVQNRMLSIFKENKITFKEIFICPHLESENCSCRKPKIGLVQKIIKTQQIDKSTSFVCGDRGTDKLFAKSLGIKFVSAKTNGNFYNTIKEVIA